MNFAREGYEEYLGRIQHYIKIKDELVVVNSKSKVPEQLMKAEAEAILKRIQPADEVILLDMKGKSYTSEKFAAFLEKHQPVTQHLVFVIGGAYGFDPFVYQRANGLLSLSAFTYSHQLVPLIFGEQLYRAFTIIKGEPYHHS